MKRRIKDKIVALNCSFGVIAAAAYLLISGCALLRTGPEITAPANDPPVIVNIRFSRPLVIKTPERKPVTVKEHILCGLFYFDQGRFEDAAGEFEEAGKRISDSRDPLHRKCVMSCAVSHLLADDKPGFMKAVRELKTTYNRYELMTIEDLDEQAKTLFQLSDEFSGNGNY